MDHWAMFDRLLAGAAKALQHAETFGGEAAARELRQVVTTDGRYVPVAGGAPAPRPESVGPRRAAELEAASRKRESEDKSPAGDDLTARQITATYPAGSHTFTREGADRWMLDLVTPVGPGPRVGPYDNANVRRILGVLVTDQPEAPGTTYPYQEGDMWVLGPQVISTTQAPEAGSVINWQGENYVVQGDEKNQLVAEWDDAGGIRVHFASPFLSLRGQRESAATAAADPAMFGKAATVILSLEEAENYQAVVMGDAFDTDLLDSAAKKIEAVRSMVPRVDDEDEAGDER